MSSSPIAKGWHAPGRCSDSGRGVNVVIEMHSGRDGAGDILVTTPALHLTAETMRRLADLHLWLDCDQYVY